MDHIWGEPRWHQADLWGLGLRDLVAATHTCHSPQSLGDTKQLAHAQGPSNAHLLDHEDVSCTGKVLGVRSSRGLRAGGHPEDPAPRSYSHSVSVSRGAWRPRLFLSAHLVQWLNTSELHQ